MATSVFISDLHLDPARPQATEAFERFLADLDGDVQTLYILGDLFESWIGDDDDAALPAHVAGHLSMLASRGVEIAFMAGNRDFALGPDYAARAGMRLLHDPTRIDLYGGAAMLMHGDTLCTDDVAYQAFRAQVRNRQWLAAMLAQPLAVRRAYAQQARAASQSHTSHTAEAILDANADAVTACFEEHHVDLIIHGHTHRPAVHRDEVNGQLRTRIVLGDWYEQGTVLYAHDDGRLRLSQLDEP